MRAQTDLDLQAVKPGCLRPRRAETVLVLLQLLQLLLPTVLLLLQQQQKAQG